MGAPLAIASLALTAASAAVAAGGAISSADAQRKSANYQAQVARNDTTTAAQNAEYATQAGQAKAYQAGIAAREQQGRVTSALAANGVDVNSGSAADVRTTQRETGALNQEQTTANAALQAYGYRTQQTSFQSQASLDAATAANAGPAGAISASGDLLSGASGLAGKWQKYQTQGTL